MLKSYFKIAFRNLLRDKLFTFINIAGLAIGMSCVIIISLWVHRELIYDRFHKNADQLFKVVGFQNQGNYVRGFPGPLSAYLKNEYPEIADACNFKDQEWKLSIGHKSFYTTGAYVEPSFLEMFSFPLIKGNPKTALSNLHSILLTQDLATKLFGNNDPIEQSITIAPFGGPLEFKVTGILENIPQTSHLQFKFLVPYELGPEEMHIWNNECTQTYVLLHTSSRYQDINIKIQDVYMKHRPTARTLISLQPLTRVHLYAPMGGGLITYVVIFSTLAFVVLLLACINFMNISTARSSTRLKEIGIRKVVGSSRVKIAKQFLCESMLLSSIALAFAVLVAEALLPSINSALSVQLKMNYSVWFLLSLAGLAIFTGAFAGSYPAIFLSSLQPISMLRSRISCMPLLERKSHRPGASRSKGFSLREVLVVVQFSLSVLFVISLMVISQQLRYVRNKDLGFDKEHVIVLEMEGELRQSSGLLKRELSHNPNILCSAICANSLIKWQSDTSVDWEGKRTDQNVEIGFNYVDYDFLKTFKMEMMSGRFFSRDYLTDYGSCIVNETAVRRMNLKDPLGKKIILFPGSQYQRSRTIIGVIPDYHTESLHTEIKPFMLMLWEGGGKLCIRIKPDDIPSTLAFIQGKVRQIAPDDPFTYHFLDEQLASLYPTEQVTGKLMRYISSLAIFISCLGLLGLASFSVERRTKEIGVRKVLGASTQGIYLLIIKEFSKWVLLANLIAWPIAWSAMNKWLQNFAYRIDLTIWPFLLSGLLALLIAFLTVSWQVVRAATANPVDNLRYE
jgi:putative ABC transport system permease protein